jgi:hypothetical protein
MEEGKYRLFDLLDKMKEKQKSEIREKEKNESMKAIHLSAIEQTIGFLKLRIDTTYKFARECKLEYVLDNFMMLGENLDRAFKPYSVSKEEFEKYIIARSAFIKDIADILRESCWFA